MDIRQCSVRKAKLVPSKWKLQISAKLFWSSANWFSGKYVGNGGQMLLDGSGGREFVSMALITTLLLWVIRKHLLISTLRWNLAREYTPRMSRSISAILGVCVSCTKVQV